MRKFNLTILFLLALLPVLFAGQTTRIPYRGIYDDDPNGTAGIYNPERGFRLEIAVDIAKKCDVWKPQEYPGITDYLESEINKYACDSVSLVQTYFYLHGYIGRQLPPEAFATMDVYFNKLRQLGKKALLRFAYETEPMGTVSSGPTMEDMFRHMKQLKPYLEKNKDVILALQAGFIGAWGEWHSSIHGLEHSDTAKIAILEKLLEVVPAEKNVQVRLPEFKNLLKGKPELYKRVSFHDDFIVIKPDRWDGDMHEGTPNFEQIVKESPYLVVDGELPWGFWSAGCDPDSPSAGWIIDGMGAARRFFLQHYTSLSVIHNYKEQHPNRMFDDANAPEYSMIVWKKSMINADSLRKYHMPVSDHYFQKKDGTLVSRSIFDYIRDHLGYRIELQRLGMPQTIRNGEALTLNLEFINRGFAGFSSERPAYFVLIDEKEGIMELPALFSSSDCQPYQPGDVTYTPLVHSISFAGKVPVSPGNYRLGLWLPDVSERLKYNPRYAVRCANGDVDWWVSKDGKYGVNVLTTIQIKP